MHNIVKHSFPVSYDTNKIQLWARNYAEEDGSSLNGRFDFLNKTFNNYEEAEKYIKNNDAAYKCFAVRYKTLPDGVSSKKLDELKKQKAEIIKTVREENYKKYFQSFKSAKVTCKNCGSVINKDYIPYHSCPVCNADMRSATELARIEKLEQKIAVIDEKIKVTEQDMINKKCEINWLVKFEYHT